MENENRAARLTGSNPANSMILISRARRLSYFGGRAESRRVWSLRCAFGGWRMKRVLLVGLDPATVDFSDPALPPGMTAEKIHAGIKLALADMTGRSWLTENCFIKPDETAVPTVERRLAAVSYDCVVVGAGVRLPPNRLALFEAVVNAIHRAAPQTAIAFNSRPEDSGAAAARWI
jgi:hypothetical protein